MNELSKNQTIKGIMTFLVITFSLSVLFYFLILNLFIQRIFTPLTSDTGNTAYFIDEFGVGLAIASLVVGFIFWQKRHQLNSGFVTSEK